MNLRRFTATLLVLALSPCAARAQGAPVSGAIAGTTSRRESNQPLWFQYG